MLIPYVSTHFKLTCIGGFHPRDLTLGRIYKIEEWTSEEDIYFTDDAGDLRDWDISSLDLEDTSFEYSLKEILK